MSPRPKMTRDEEHEFYARPENQDPQGPPRRRRSRLTEMVPVRFAPETLEEVRDRADADDRSVSAWIRRAVEHELEGKGRENVSNNLSNEQRRRGVEKPADLHQRGRRRTHPDDRGPSQSSS